MKTVSSISSKNHPVIHVPFRRWLVILGILMILLFVMICICTAIGPVGISPWIAIKVITRKLLNIPWSVDWQAMDDTILLEIRFPRILLAALVGFALASSGVIYQTLLRNPLADPFIIGVSSGAAVGAIVAMALHISQSIWGFMGVPLFAFLGGLLTIILILSLAQTRGRIHAHTLLLAGVIVNAFFSAVIMFIASVIDASRIQSYMLWMIGHLDVTDSKLLAVVGIYVLIGWVILLLYSRHLNVMSFGEETAQQLGINVERTKKIVFIASSLIAGAVVSISGIIGFIGLMIPHIMRSWVGSDHRILLPASALGGAIFMVVTDTIARTILAPTEIPVGVITALCGAPFFIYLLRSRRWRSF